MGRPIGSHAPSIEIERFRTFLTDGKPFHFDIMLEIKDKDVSALKAIMVAAADGRFVGWGRAAAASGTRKHSKKSTFFRSLKPEKLGFCHRRGRLAA